MPHLTLTLSHNIDVTKIGLRVLFESLHAALDGVPGLDVATCQSGLIQQSYSYVGFGDDKLTKVYLQFEWLDKPGRAELKPMLAERLMSVLENILAPQITKQNLICSPRVHIGTLGVLSEDYYMSKTMPLSS